MKVYTAFPDNKLSNDALASEFEDINVGRLEKKLGITSRYVARQDETAFDLAIKACEKVDKEELGTVDFVVYCTQSPDYFLPSTACIIQEKLGLRKSCGAFDYNLGCSGYIYGLAMAKSFIQSGVASKVLLVTSETYTKLIHPTDWTNRAIFGDGATGAPGPGNTKTKD